MCITYSILVSFLKRIQLHSSHSSYPRDGRVRSERWKRGMRSRLSKSLSTRCRPSPNGCPSVMPDSSARRRFLTRDCDVCISVIDTMIFPTENSDTPKKPFEIDPVSNRLIEIRQCRLQKLHIGIVHNSSFPLQHLSHFRIPFLLAYACFSKRMPIDSLSALR